MIWISGPVPSHSHGHGQGLRQSVGRWLPRPLSDRFLAIVLSVTDHDIYHYMSDTLQTWTTISVYHHTSINGTTKYLCRLVARAGETTMLCLVLLQTYVCSHQGNTQENFHDSHNAIAYVISNIHNVVQRGHRATYCKVLDSGTLKSLSADLLFVQPSSYLPCACLLSIARHEDLYRMRTCWHLWVTNCLLDVS